MLIPVMAEGQLSIAAASDLRYALDSIVTEFSKDADHKINVTYGSSGKLTQQIIHGGPFDMFFSADVSYLETLQENKRLASDIQIYGKGRLVLWSPIEDVKTKGLSLLRESRIKKIAIANPEHAPYGKRAMEALAFFKLSNTTASRLVYGENVSQAAQFVLSGNADAGIIALSIALSPNMQREGYYYIIDEKSHEPLLQGVVITSYGKENDLAKSFFTFLKGNTAQSILRKFGFDIP